MPIEAKISHKDKNIANQSINSSRVYQFDVGVNMKGIVTLYKVNTSTLDTFIVNYSDRIDAYLTSTTKSLNSLTNDNTTAQHSNSTITS